MSGLNYRSANDPQRQIHKRFLLIDTPGHGKLRYYALENLIKPQHLKGIIFMVDAATLSAGDNKYEVDSAREAAEYLHDVLLQLQKRTTSSKTTKATKAIPVLIAANKLDLFTALPAALTTTILESEITNVRSSKAKGLLDSGVGLNEADPGEGKDWLGDGSEGRFEFPQMTEVRAPVTVLGGNVLGGNGADIGLWLEWIRSNL
ncbi:hypothetical protein MMC06_006493 [Schaereria dolodes]|nr:hypothetical protein [Schaereria dolodes]